MRARLGVILGIVAVIAIVPVAGAVAGDRSGDRHHDRGGHHHKSWSVRAAVEAHIDAVEECDADALVAGYSRDAKVFFPDGVVVEGRDALQELYDGFVKAPPDGLCGITITAEDSFKRGGTVFVKFRVEAPFLAEPYYSTDGYVIERGKILSEVSTFDASKLKFK